MEGGTGEAVGAREPEVDATADAEAEAGGEEDAEAEAEVDAARFENANRALGFSARMLLKRVSSSRTCFRQPTPNAASYQIIAPLVVWWESWARFSEGGSDRRELGRSIWC